MIVKDITGKGYEVNECLGCSISKGEAIPFGGVLYKDEFFHIEHDFEVPIKGFVIISCINHFTKLTELPPKAQHRLIDLTNKVISILSKNNIASQFTTLIEERPNYHLHLWIIPRHDWIVEKFGKIIYNYANIKDYAIKNLNTTENINEIKKTCNLIKTELNK